MDEFSKDKRRWGRVGIAGGVPPAWLGLHFQPVEGPRFKTPPHRVCVCTPPRTRSHPCTLPCAPTPACTHPCTLPPVHPHPHPAPTPPHAPQHPTTGSTASPAVGLAAGHTDELLRCQRAVPHLPGHGAASAAVTTKDGRGWTFWSLNTSPAAAGHPKGCDQVCGGARSIPGCRCLKAPVLREGSIWEYP